MGCGSSKAAAAALKAADAALKAAEEAAEEAAAAALRAASEAAAELQAAKAEAAALKADERLSALDTAEDAKAAAAAADEERANFALASHLSLIIGIGNTLPDIQRYASNLRKEGYDLPEDFDELTVDELKGESFCFKPGHLKKVARSRSRKNANSVSYVEPNDAKPTVRGQCSLCGLEVLDSQPRLKDPISGLYQHVDCGASGAGSAALLTSASRTSLEIFPAAEEADDEADAVRTSAISEAKQRGESRAAAQNAKAMLRLQKRRTPR